MKAQTDAPPLEDGYRITLEALAAGLDPDPDRRAVRLALATTEARLTEALTAARLADARALVAAAEAGEAAALARKALDALATARAALARWPMGAAKQESPRD
jgi:hypothetical protein